MQTIPLGDILYPVNPQGKATDTIPRASIQQLATGLQVIATKGGRSTYEAVRLSLLAAGKRRAPSTATALWTVARDVLSEIARLRLGTVGPLPRKLSDFPRLRDTPCELSPEGHDLAGLFREKAGQAYDTLLLRWLNDHPYFRAVVARLERGPLYVPDVTNLGQLGIDGSKTRDVGMMGAQLVANCKARLEKSDWPVSKVERFIQGVERRLREQGETLAAPGTEAKRAIDLVQDSVVIPAFLEAESLPFDAVTFAQILKAGQEFLCAAWTSAHPRFSGRIVFGTCDFDAALSDGSSPIRVVHHGASYAAPRFPEALRGAYAEATGASGGYASAYVIRAMVCLELRIPFAVFARCLETTIAAGADAGMTLYTELPFEPPPQGESHIEVGKRRVGRLKVV